MARAVTGEVRPPEPNPSLKLLLDEVGWRPEALARRVNAVLQQHPGKRRVHEKTPYHWLRGASPRAPIPDIVVELLVQALKRPISFDMVWPATTPSRPSRIWLGGDLDVPWDHAGLQHLLGEWRLGMLTRRTFLTLSGVALTGPAWEWLDAPASIPEQTTSSHVPPSLMSLIETTVAGAQQLDEEHGSAAADFVGGQFDSVARLVRTGSYDANTGKRLCTALAQLAQTSGWMAQEAALDGRAQRWYLTGLHAAHSAGDRGVAASIMALMSNHATTLGKHRDALQLAAAATEAASHTPTAVQALIASRSALAHAGAGDLTGVERARDRAAGLISEADEERPAWASYVTPTELDALAGRALVMLARQVPGRRNRLILKAEPLLRERALDASDAHRRSALRHSALLSLAYTGAGDLDQAVHAGRLAVRRLPMVTSVRCLSLLDELRSELMPHSRRLGTVQALIREIDEHVPTSR
ncbi:hypothetical protein [Nonomuraea sp. NPDC005650]|uniref:hypothetical protein n=1 Tax=Nonomuraea sp. NPDC005650 TaxID=3157045 RepID=UPI0033B7446A